MGSLRCRLPAVLLGVALGALLAVTPALTAASAGELDPGFGTGGKGVVVFPGFFGTAAALALRPDGRIVLAGTLSAGAPNLDFGIARLTAAGAPDADFGVSGRSAADMGGTDTAHAVALQPDGKILTAGRTSLGGGQFAVARTTATGLFDPEFDGDGRAYVTFPGDFGALAIARQPDGKVLVAGSSSASANDGIAHDFAVARLNANGSLDATFRDDENPFGLPGKVTVGFGGHDVARGLAVQADGRIVVAGRTSHNGGEMVLTRLLADGDIDRSFGLPGGAVYPGLLSAATDSGGWDVALQPDGKILVVGIATDATASRLGVVRLNPDGSLDQSFDGDGRAFVEFGQIASGRALALQPDGKIVVGGYRLDPAADFTASAAVARLNADGSLDTSFGEAGKKVLGECNIVSGLAVQPDGKLLVAGEVCGPPGGLTVLRLLGDTVEPPPPPPNQPPVASFVYAPASPGLGAAVTFTSTSGDPDGVIVASEWDLNGDGVFAEASGTSATWAFVVPGTHRVGLRVTDDAGAVATTSRDVTVVGVPPRNTQRPEIIGGSGALLSLLVCTPGEWDGLPPNPIYEFTWRKQVYDRSRLLGVRWDVVGTDAVYRIRTGDLGSTFSCEVRVRNPYGQGRAFSLDTVHAGDRSPFALGAPYGNMRVRGIDVFQTVQPNAGAQMSGHPPGPFPSICGGGTPTSYRALGGLFGCVLDGAAQRVAYAGVPLDRDKRAVAVVYVDMAQAAASSASRRLEVTLRALIGGRPLSGELVQTIADPPRSTSPWVTPSERNDPAFGVQFDVPQAWLALGTFGRLDLQATVRFPAASAYELRRPYECAESDRDCSTDNSFRLDGIPVARMPEIRFETLYLRSRERQSFPTGEQVLRKATQLFPGGEQMVFVDSGVVMDIREITGLTLESDACKQSKFETLRSCMQAWISFHLTYYRPRGDSDIVFALHDYTTSDEDSTFTEPGYAVGGLPTLEVMGSPTYTGGGPNRYRPIITATTGASRPLTAAAHELGHAIAAPHAGQDCDGTRAGEKQEGERWPPDDQGRLQGTLFDVTAARVNGRIPPRVDGAPSGDTTTMLFDLMSYCSGEARAWISPRNWSRFHAALVAYGRKFAAVHAVRRAAARHATQAIALGLVGPGGGRVVRLIPAAAAPAAPPAAPGSPVRLRAFDGAGRLLADVGVELRGTSEGARDEGAFAGAVPAAAVAVELVRNGVVLDRLQRSAVPQVRLLAPGARTVVRARRPLVVRWRASDADRTALHATVDYSPDGGRTWRTAFAGPSRGSARIPGRVLETSARARVRVRVGDGFSEATAVSRPFAVEGTPPRVAILAPAAGGRLVAGERTLLSGSAVDDRGRRLGRRAVTWYAGKRRLGSGAELTVRLPAGRATLRLVARDDRGRTQTATRRVSVQPAPLVLTVLEAPERVARSARTLSLRIAASGPATLTAGGKRYAIGAKARRIDVALPARPATGLLEIRFAVTARGSHVRGTLRSSLALVRG